LAELIKRQHNLLTLKMNLGSASGAAQEGQLEVELELDQGGDVLASTELPPDALGIPADFDPAAYRYSEPSFVLPDALRQQILEPARQQLRDENALWLQLASPCGYLPLIPWERLLRPVVDAPILRIPNFTLFPSLTADALDVVLCASQPRAKAAFDVGTQVLKISSKLLEAQLPDLSVHVFTDREVYGELRAKGAGGPTPSDGPGLHLYDPADAQAPVSETPPEGISDQGDYFRNPWLVWIAREMAGRSVEAVHFIAHGYLSGDQAALAVAESPTLNDDRQWARFIGPNQMAAFLTQIGAWSVGFSSPSINFSLMGSRLCVDKLARLRTGPILLHEVAGDPECDALTQAYIALLSQTGPRMASDIVLYCHPRLFPETAWGDEMGYAESLVTSALGAERPSGSTSSWVTSTRRYLEQTAAVLFPEQADPGSAEQLAAGEGVKRAFQFIGEVINKAGPEPTAEPPKASPAAGPEVTA
jgi:hypothetical protein